MEVFVGNLAVNVTYADLVGFFKGFASKAKIRIIEQQQRDGTKVRYGIALFVSDKLALKAIRKLNGKPLRDQPVVLREYFHRCYANERRALDWRDKPWSGVERRRQERRNQKPSPQIPSSESAQSRPNKGANRTRINAFAHLARKG